ncbi:MAG: hypothetical protein LBD65_05800, partial [Spirochaetaceae bacterium]|nr:hypothetical protein [Spirochaetaceae bacterium]
DTLWTDYLKTGILRTVLAQNGSKCKVCPQSNRLCGQTLTMEALIYSIKLISVSLGNRFPDFKKGGVLPFLKAGFKINRFLDRLKI